MKIPIPCGTSYWYPARTKEKLSALGSNIPRCETYVPYFNYIFSNPEITPGDTFIIPNFIDSIRQFCWDKKDYLFPYPLTEQHNHYYPIPVQNFSTRNCLFTLFAPEFTLCVEGIADSPDQYNRKSMESVKYKTETPPRIKMGSKAIGYPLSPQSGYSLMAANNLLVSGLGAKQYCSLNTRRHIFNVNKLFFEKTNNYYLYTKINEIITSPSLCFSGLKNLLANDQRMKSKKIDPLPLTIDSDFYRNTQKYIGTISLFDQVTTLFSYILLFGSTKLKGSNLKPGMDELVEKDTSIGNSGSIKTCLPQSTIDLRITYSALGLDIIDYEQLAVKQSGTISLEYINNCNKPSVISLGYMHATDFYLYYLFAPKRLNKRIKYKSQKERQNNVFVYCYLWGAENFPQEVDGLRIPNKQLILGNGSILGEDQYNSQDKFYNFIGDEQIADPDTGIKLFTPNFQFDSYNKQLVTRPYPNSIKLMTVKGVPSPSKEPPFILSILGVDGDNTTQFKQNIKRDTALENLRNDTTKNTISPIPSKPDQQFAD